MKSTDLILDREYKRGTDGKKTRLIQEWLILHGFRIVLDGEYGPATEHAVKQFQATNSLPVTGVVDNKTFTLLIQPLTRAMAPIQVVRGVTTFSGLIAAYAIQHLEQHPREVGGQNRGPWVRYYMDGNEGTEWAWCAGFACTVMKQACATLEIPLPIEPDVSCDVLAARAKKAGLFIPEKEAGGKVRPGSFFLVRKSETDWTHVGIVMQAQEEVFSTAEGNSNDEGSREGHEVCELSRGYEGKDFIVWRG